MQAAIPVGGVGAILAGDLIVVWAGQQHPPAGWLALEGFEPRNLVFHGGRSTEHRGHGTV